VLTMGGMASGWVSAGEMVASSTGGPVPAIVHQYDRHVDLRRRVEARYGQGASA